MHDENLKFKVFHVIAAGLKTGMGGCNIIAIGDHQAHPAISNSRRSSITWTPRLRALSSFEPASSPAST